MIQLRCDNHFEVGAFVRKHMENPKQLSPELKENFDFMTIAMLQANATGKELKYASEKLQDDEKLVTLAVKKHPEALKYASARLQALMTSTKK